MIQDILIIDDDLELCQMLREYLELEGFHIELAHTGEQGIFQLSTRAFALVILDIMLPTINGIETLKRIRQHYQIPVIMLTAKGEDIDRVVGLEMGADDYLAKPFNPRELIARIRAILRRVQNTIVIQDIDTNIQIGDLELKLAERIANWHNQTLDITSTEFNILEILAVNAGSPVTKANLSEQALGKKLQRYDRSLDMHISNLRQKLGDLPDGRSPIQTIRGLGYQLIKQ